jgi:hypothetical protein
MIVDAPTDAMENFNGTLGVVWLDEVVDPSNEDPLFGAVSGAWTDFHRDWR